MTYGFRPENWYLFQRELWARGIAVDDIEKVELGATGTPVGTIEVTVTLRSGRVASWRQPQAERVFDARQ